VVVDERVIVVPVSEKKYSDVEVVAVYIFDEVPATV
jgi:hypothetical protein